MTLHITTRHFLCHMCNSLMLNVLMYISKWPLENVQMDHQILWYPWRTVVFKLLKKIPKHPKHQTYTTQFRLSVSLTEKRTTRMQQLPWSHHVKLRTRTFYKHLWGRYILFTKSGQWWQIHKCILTKKNRTNRSLTRIGIGMNTNRGFKD